MIFHCSVCDTVLTVTMTIPEDETLQQTIVDTGVGQRTFAVDPCATCLDEEKELPMTIYHCSVCDTKLRTEKIDMYSPPPGELRTTAIVVDPCPTCLDEEYVKGRETNDVA